MPQAARLLPLGRSKGYADASAVSVASGPAGAAGAAAPAAACVPDVLGSALCAPCPFWVAAAGSVLSGGVALGKFWVSGPPGAPCCACLSSCSPVICSTRCSGFCPRPTIKPIKKDQPTAAISTTPSRVAIGADRRRVKRRLSLAAGAAAVFCLGLRNGGGIPDPCLLSFCGTPGGSGQSPCLARHYKCVGCSYMLSGALTPSTSRPLRTTCPTDRSRARRARVRGASSASRT